MENKSKFIPNPKLRLMDQVRQVLRYHHYSYRTEQTYCDWIIRFVKFHSNQKHPKNMGKTEIEAFLSHLATNRKVAASNQRQALNALVFLYKHVLDKPIGDDIAPVKAKKRRRPPMVMTKTEIRQVLNQMIKPCFFTRPLIFITEIVAKYFRHQNTKITLLMQNTRQKFGQQGESLAVWYLKKNGYKILEQNYRTKLGEIDIIAKEKKTLVFVEVKSRRSIRFGNPKWAVTLKKQRQISMVALSYLKATKQSDTKARFDVVAITANQDQPQIEIVKNAFELAYE